MKTTERLSPDDLRGLLTYDAETGKLFWKARESVSHGWNARNAGREAFTATRKDGYKWGTIHNHQYLAHRVAFAIHTGSWPEIIDHINGNRSDNRIENLRSVSMAENGRNGKLRSNNQSGYNGVFWSSRWKKWKAWVSFAGKSYALGAFNCPTAAAIRRVKANQEFGFHPNHGAKR